MVIKLKELQSRYFIDSVSGCTCRSIKASTERFVLHRHDFYELFLVTAGQAKHQINGYCEQLCSGSLVFVRASDCHNYTSVSNNFAFVNLSFTKATLAELQQFLGCEAQLLQLKSQPLSPMLLLPAPERDRIFARYRELLQIPFKNKAELRCRARILLTELLGKFFSQKSAPAPLAPGWLLAAYSQMQQPKNFVAGKQRFYALCQKTPEHAARTLKQFYGVTPTELVNSLRLTYAAGLLRQRGYRVLDVCFECGFENPPWFYKAFAKKFGCTPAAFKVGKAKLPPNL